MRINRKKLIDAMKEKNINHRELAELAGVTRMTVHNVKRGYNCSSHTGECAIFITSKSSDTPLQPQWAIGKNFSSVQAIGNPVA